MSIQPIKDWALLTALTLAGLALVITAVRSLLFSLLVLL